jgi:hypothetical protein
MEKEQLGKLHYARVYEQQMDGSTHFHCVATLPDVRLSYGRNGKSKSSARWIKDTARECGMGYQTDFEVIDEGAWLVVNYVAKYMTKQEVKWPKGTRLVQTSQKWPKRDPGDKSEYNWKRQQEITEYDLNRWYRQGKEVFDLNAHEPITYDRINSDGKYTPLDNNYGFTDTGS